MYLPNPQRVSPRFAGEAGFTPIIIIVVLLLVLAAGVGVYFFTNNLNKPARIKEKTEVTQPIFKDYSRSVDKVVEHLQEEADGDPESLERYNSKGQGLIKSAEENLKSLKPLVEKIDIAEQSKYKKSLENYITKAEEITQIDKDQIALYEGYINPLKDYEQLTVDISGVSNYLYSDPARYVKEVNAGIVKEDKIIKQLEAVEARGEWKAYHEEFLKTVKTEKTLLQAMVKAVEDRDSDAIAAALKEYTENSQNNSRDLKRVTDKTNDKIEDLANEVEVAAEEVEKEYDNLKSSYKF